MKTCAEIMTINPTCCLSTDTVSKAAQRMQKENVGSIPVIESEQSKKLIGIVTDRDLALKVIADGHDTKLTTVGDVMTDKVVTCRGEDDVQKAVEAMAKHQLRRIPVVDHDNMILGIISQADIATRGVQPEKTAEMVKDISQPKAEK